MKLYRSYVFKDKDPVIDAVWTAIQTYAAARGLTEKQAIADAAKSGVRKQTIRNWRYGGVRRPFFYTVTKVGVAMGDPRFMAFLPPPKIKWSRRKKQA